VGRRPASGDRLGALVYNPGGPGVGGVEYVSYAKRITGDDVLDHFDFVSFDPRGTGGSGAIDCVTDAELDRLLSQDPTPDDAGEATALAAGNRAFGRACEAKGAPLVEHVDTLAVVRDLDLLRAVLGEPRLNFLGASYGTFIGAWYAETFPWRVGRMVLDGAVDPSLELADYVAGQAQGFDRGFTDYLNWCLDHARCPFRGTLAQARDQVGALVEGADHDPLSTDDPVRPLTQGLMATGIAQGLYSDSIWPTLNEALRDALSGDGAALLEMADTYNERSADGRYGPVLEANPSIFCLDHGENRDPAEISKAADALEQRYPPLGGFIGWGALGCSQWPIAPALEPQSLTADGAAPILVVGTVGDPATPYEWAQSLGSQLASGSLLTWEGSGHTAYGRGGRCIDDAVEAYLIAGTIPADGSRCPA
jgi:pimeloyl-ACP methyl ester carboxylesterase